MEIGRRNRAWDLCPEILANYFQIEVRKVEEKNDDVTISEENYQGWDQAIRDFTSSNGDVQ
jgi:hypothetical protein